MPGPLGTDANVPIIDAGTTARTATPPPGPTCASRRTAAATTHADVTPAEGAKIVAEAATWAGTPYALVGDDSEKGVGGDCSGSTCHIYAAAGFGYDYQQSGTFRAYAAQTGLFRPVDVPAEPMQDGDVLSWADHMAIHADFAADDPNRTTARVKDGRHFTQVNDMWTATKPGGPPYQPHKASWFKGGVMPKVYRYQHVTPCVRAP